MNNADYYGEVARALARRAHEHEEKYGAYRGSSNRYSIDSMPVVVEYTAHVGRVEYFKRGEEHIFVQTTTRPDGQYGEQWEDVEETPYAIRDEFSKVKTVGQAVEFLQKTGWFSPLRQRITWREFQKWQQFARLVQEHNELAATMQSANRSGDCAEVLKALTGNYRSSFFDGCGEDALYLPVPPDDDLTDNERLERLLQERDDASSPEEWQSASFRANLEQADQNRRARLIAELTDQNKKEEWERQKEQQRRELWQWFIKPPVRIEWTPISEEAAQKVIKLHIDAATGIAIPIPEESPIMRGGSMVEFLLPQDQLRPALVITAKYALQAIAAAIYAERIQGITSRKCAWCGELFRIERHKNKLYCDSPKPCKGNAQKQRQRVEQRKRKSQQRVASKNQKRTARKVEWA